MCVCALIYVAHQICMVLFRFVCSCLQFIYSFMAIFFQIRAYFVFVFASHKWIKLLSYLPVFGWFYRCWCLCHTCVFSHPFFFFFFSVNAFLSVTLRNTAHSYTFLSAIERVLLTKVDTNFKYSFRYLVILVLNMLHLTVQIRRHVSSIVCYACLVIVFVFHPSSAYFGQWGVRDKNSNFIYYLLLYLFVCLLVRCVFIFCNFFLIRTFFC